MTAWLSEHADVDGCDVTTTGRRSGRPHEIEIWFGVIGLTRQAWCYEVPVLAISEWREP